MAELLSTQGVVLVSQMQTRPKNSNNIIHAEVIGNDYDSSKYGRKSQPPKRKRRFSSGEPDTGKGALRRARRGKRTTR